MLPRRNIAPLSVARAAPEGPFSTRRFVLYFELDSDFLAYQYGDWIIDQAVTWSKAARPARLVITGYSVTRPEIIDGVLIAEKPAVAKQWALAIARIMERLLPGVAIVVHWPQNPLPNNDPEADGLPWQSQRRVDILAEIKR